VQSLTHLLSTFTSASVEAALHINKPINNIAYLILMSPFLLWSSRNRSNNVSLILRIPKVKAPGYPRALSIFYLMVPRSSNPAGQDPGAPDNGFPGLSGHGANRPGFSPHSGTVEVEQEALLFAPICNVRLRSALKGSCRGLLYS
jgi:hypothetical protein